MRPKPYSTARYVFPILFALIAVAVFAAPVNKVIVPGAIEFSNGKITGTFVMTTTGGPDSFLSNGTGGACLVADLNGSNIPDTRQLPNGKCTKDSDCQRNLPREGLFQSEWYGYCDTKVEHNCWVRPGPGDPDGDLCNKQPDTPWGENVKHPSNKEPFDLSTPRYEAAPSGVAAGALISFSEKFPGPVRWRVVGHLRGVTPTEFKLFFGPPKWVPYRPFTSPARRRRPPFNPSPHPYPEPNPKPNRNP